MEEQIRRDMLKYLANKVRRDYNIVAFYDEQEVCVKVLKKHSLVKYYNIEFIEQLDIENSSTGRKGIELTDDTMYKEVLGIVEEDLSKLCNLIAHKCGISQIYHADEMAYLCEKPHETYTSVIEQLREMIAVERRAVISKKDNALKSLRLANSIRKKYKSVTYLKESTLEVMTFDGNKEVPIKRNLIGQISNKESLNTKNIVDIEEVKHLIFYNNLIINNAVFGVDEEYGNLYVCDMISKYLKVGDIHLHNNKIYIHGEKMNTKPELFLRLPEIIFNTSKENHSVITLDNLAKKAYSSEYVQEDKAVILDGVAYIAESQTILGQKVGSYYMEGYIFKDQVIWSRLDRDKFKVIQTEQGDIHLLETLVFSDLDIVYRTIKENERSKTIEAPYPIAILEDGAYAYYFENKEGIR